MHVQTRMHGGVRSDALCIVGNRPASDDDRARHGATQRTRRAGMDFPEPDYRFGTGEVRMTIDSVDWSTPQTHEGETWYDVRGPRSLPMAVSSVGVGPW